LAFSPKIRAAAASNHGGLYLLKVVEPLVEVGFAFGETRAVNGQRFFALGKLGAQCVAFALGFGERGGEPFAFIVVCGEFGGVQRLPRAGEEPSEGDEESGKDEGRDKGGHESSL